MSSETTQLPKPNFGVKALVSVETRVRYALGNDRITIGRAEDNQICLNCDVYASSHHAEITFDGEAFWLNDLGSRNGTIRNGEIVDKPVRISCGDVITIGRVHLQAE